MNDANRYPDEAIMFSPLEQPALLVAAEYIVKLATDETPDQDQRAAIILAHAAQLCYNQGVATVIDRHTKAGDSISDMESDIYDALHAGQCAWEMVSKYYKDMLSIELHPLGMMTVLLVSINNSAGDESEEFRLLSRVIKQYLEDVEKKEKEELKNVDVKPVPEVENSDKSDSELMIEYFKLMEEIGTFYHDRDRYDTEEKRELHDRIVAIFNKIRGSVC